MKKLSVDLGDRVLRFDGVSIVSPDAVARLLLLGLGPHEIRVSDENWEIQQFNANVPGEDELRPSSDPVKINLAWQLPPDYKNLDITERVIDALAERADELKYSGLETAQAAERIAEELVEIKRRGMMEFMRTVIYVLDTFRQNGVVWGVGRGSSCACYILFILGLHAVDCLKLDVPAEEFFHE